MLAILCYNVSLNWPYAYAHSLTQSVGVDEDPGQNLWGVAYIEDHVLLNLWNELGGWGGGGGGEEIKYEVCNEFYKFNNTGAGMWGSIYHTTLKLLLNRDFAWKH